MNKDRNGIENFGGLLMIAGIVVLFIRVIYLLLTESSIWVLVAIIGIVLGGIIGIVLGGIIVIFISKKNYKGGAWEEKYFKLNRAILNHRFFGNNNLSEEEQEELDDLRFELQRTISMMDEFGMENWHRDFLVNLVHIQPMIQRGIWEYYQHDLDKIDNLKIHDIKWLKKDYLYKDYGILYSISDEAISAGKFLGIIK